MSKIGIIGGSALYKIDSLEIKEEKTVRTPFGEPSDSFILGNLAGKEVVFLPRHGKNHTFLPTEVNYRANIYAMKTLGVDRIISVSAVGSLRKEVKPLDVLLIDQFIDRTNQARKMTFFGDGIVAHVPFAEPVCSCLREAVYKANKSMDVTIHNGGTYINMEGPMFSTKAESFLYKSWGADTIGMTNLAEARLSREAGICYVSIAMITDYDCWYAESEVETVSADMVMQNLRKNAEIAKKMLTNTLSVLPETTVCRCHEALKNSIVTPKEAISKELLKKLEPIIKGFI